MESFDLSSHRHPYATLTPDTTITILSSSSSSLSTQSPTLIELNRTRRTLEEINNAQFSWYHLRSIIISGVGFFTDAYDIFAINIASTMLGYLMDAGGSSSNEYELAIKVATPIGTLIGQLLFGWLADHYGRSKIYGSELIIITLSTLCQALSSPRWLVGWRFLLGIGIGGDYPLSATITSEVAAVKIRGRMITAVFASQGFGQLAASIVSLVIVKVAENSIKTDIVSGTSIDTCWRLLIGLGSIPAACALYFRLTIRESDRFRLEVQHQVQGHEDDERRGFLRHDSQEEKGLIVKDHDVDQELENVDEMEQGGKRSNPLNNSGGDFWKHYRQWEHLKVLFGCAWSWFALDLAFYGLGLNSSIVLSAIGFGQSLEGTTNDRIYQSLINVSVGNIVLSIVGLIPGYWVAFAFIDSWGRKPIQIMGFAALTLIFIIMGLWYHQLVDHSLGTFVVLYCLGSFFFNFGPNTTTFVIPAECFPTRFRSTSHGISAASGKLGAILSQLCFAGLKDIGGKDQFIDKIFLLFSGFMLSGLFSSLLVPETKGKTLEELSGEKGELDLVNGRVRCDSYDIEP